MMKSDDRIVNGFRFTTKEEADLARMELEKIRIMGDKLDYDNLELVHSVYDRAILNRTFRTPVGYQFLVHLRHTLLDNGYREEELKPIPLSVRFAPVIRNQKTEKAETVVTSLPEKGKRSIHISASVLLNIILILLVVAMFVITLHSDNPNILNYRKQVINEYASWETQLREKEAELREREQKLQENSSQNGQKQLIY